MPLLPPPDQETTVSMVEARLEAVLKGAGVSETVRIEWRGQARPVPVIDMPIDLLYYNPETHRVRAQRDHAPDRDAQLTRQPWSVDGQAYLHDLIKSSPQNPDRTDPEFQALMEDLSLHSQTDPGLITPSGILVNGNTRRAALKELGQRNMRVGVLPSDWSWDDVGSIELVLQLRKEHRRDYSYINRLITIKEEIAKGRAPADISRQFRTTTKSLNRDLWALMFIDDAIARSRVKLEDGSTTSLRRMDFEGHQETLKEIHDRYVQMRKSDPDDAERRKESSLVAVLANKAKTAIRAIWLVDDFERGYFAPRLGGESAAPAAPPEQGTVQIPGLDISVPAADSRVDEARKTTDALLHAKAKAAVSARLSESEKSAAIKVVKSVGEAISAGLESAERDVKHEQKKLKAPEKLDEATDALKNCIADIAKARSQSVLDHEALDDALVRLRETLTKLTVAASRGVVTPGEGLSWLQRATSADE